MFKRLLVILLIIAATIGYSLYQTKVLESQLVKPEKSETVLTKLPEGTFETLEGESYVLASETADLLIVHFWGTWCGPCEAELPELISLIERFEGRPGVKFLLVAVNDEVFKIRKHLKTLNLPNSNVVWLLDNKNVHRDIFGTTRVPETYVFSSDKTTLRKYTGPQEWNKAMFFQSFVEFLQISSNKL